LEPKFWQRFCERIDRPDLVDRHGGAQLAFGDDDVELARELTAEFAKATAAQWLSRFLEWDVPGGPVLDVPAIMETDHFRARAIIEREEGGWPNVTTAIRWQHTGGRAGDGLGPPPAFDADHDAVLADWLSDD
jgi:crotonobetainyl-CoA:carnitine CoA-transferase CaiB-like acyl-CoA transferase